MNATVYISRDSSALSMGAQSVVAAIQEEAKRRGDTVKMIRTGSRGMLWLEPLVEVDTTNGRIAYGPVSRGDVTSLFESEFLQGRPHPLYMGLTEEIQIGRATC